MGQLVPLWVTCEQEMVGLRLRYRLHLLTIAE
jgi:hypothetical protein